MNRESSLLANPPAPPASTDASIGGLSIGKKMSWEEFLVWAPDSKIAEWVNGEAFIMPPPSVRHQRLIAFLSDLLRWFVRTRNMGEVFFAPLLMKMSHSGREPDILFISNATQHRLRELYLDGPADLVVEVISPDGRKRDRQEKFREYEEAGVREYWLIDPARQQADFYFLNASGKYELLPIDSEGIVHSVVLDGLRLKISWLWQEQLPNLESIIA
jgi:Uma2 family endonuclease